VAAALGRADRVLSALGAAVTSDWPASFGIADAALVAATGYLTFRHGDGWRARHPEVARHVDRWSDRPSVAATPVRG
jgi:glutathione S-transferase